MTTTTSWKQTCRDCKRRVNPDTTVYTSRFGGGSYRRPGRYYRGHTCVRCIEPLIPYIAPNREQTGLDTRGDTSRYPASGLISNLITLINRGHSDLDEDRWRAKFPDGTFYTFAEWFPAPGGNRRRGTQSTGRARTRNPEGAAGDPRRDGLSA